MYNNERMVMDEFEINGRRYRVPERVIVLDFWKKLDRREARKESVQLPFKH